MPQTATCQQESNRLARGSTVHHLLWNFLACQALGLYNNKVKKSTVLLCQNKQNLKYVLLEKKNHWELNCTKASSLKKSAHRLRCFSE